MQYPPVSLVPGSAGSEIARAARRWLIGTAVTLLAACGGGGSGSDGDSSNPATGDNQPQAGPAVRVEVEPAALLLTAVGQQQRLTVRAFDRDGRAVATAVTWQPSRPAEVDVASDGTVRAASALGSGQIVAVVDGVRSAPVLVAVGQPAAGVLLVNDAQFATDPVAIDPQAEPSIDNEYEVVLAGVPAPAVGSLLLGREGKAIGGEVLASTPVAGGVRVRLRVVPIEQLMLTAQIKEDIDLSGLPLQVPADIEALYEVRVENDEYIFTPRPGATPSAVPEDGRQRALAIKKFKLGPFACDLVGSELPISLSQPSTFTLKFVPSYVVDYERSTGLKRVLFRAEAGFKLKNSLQVNASGLVNLTCETTLLERLVPLPGFAGLLLAGQLQAGIGFETEGTVAIPLLGVELAAEIKGKMEAGIDCTSGSCRMVSDWKPEASNSLRFITPAQALANARSEFFLFGYGFGKLRLGLTLVSQARIDAVTVRGGLKFETSLAPAATQLAPVDPGLPDYRSNYKLHALAEVAAGSLNKGDTAFRALLQKLGIFKVTLLKLQLSVPLADSPKGTASFSGADVARDGEFVDGKTLAFNVKIDPSTASFPVLGYNVGRVRIFFVADGLLPREVASLEAKAGQTEFDLSWIAEGTAGASGRGFAAFVDTALPLPVSLELGKVQQLPGVFRGRLKVTEARFIPFPGITPNGVNLIGSSENYLLDAEVEHDGGFTLLYVSKSAGVDVTVKQQIRRGFSVPPCSATKVDEVSGTGSGTTTSVLPGDSGTLELDFGKARWKLSNARLIVPILSRGTESVFFTGVAGDCTGVDLSGSSQPKVSETLNNHTISFTDPNTRQSLSGEIVLDADGRRTLNFDGTAVSIAGQGSSLLTTVSLDMKEGASKSASTDLSVALVATPTVKPLGTLTYSVNLQNLGIGAATEVRAEFNVPPGWSVIGRVGWSGCSVSQTTVVCRTERMEPGEQRAFLVDVRAPEALGLYTIGARVSAAEVDTDFSNNRTETTSTIVE